MNYEEMSIEELKSIAKDRDMTIGNIGKVKLIAKLKENDMMASLMDDDEIDDVVEEAPVVEDTKKDNGSLLESISSAIDELDEVEEEDSFVEERVELSNDELIPVKSITFGGLTYKSRSTGAIIRWNQIGEIQYMKVSEINEMNNFKRAMLNKPRVILLDERAVKKFRLTPVYENVAKINNLKALFNSDMATIKKTIADVLRVNMRDLLISKVRQMIKTRKLTDINIIRLLEEDLKFDFSEEIK